MFDEFFLCAKLLCRMEIDFECEVITIETCIGWQCVCRRDMAWQWVREWEVRRGHIFVLHGLAKTGSSNEIGRMCVSDIMLKPMRFRVKAPAFPDQVQHLGRLDWWDCQWGCWHSHHEPHLACTGSDASRSSVLFGVHGEWECWWSVVLVYRVSSFVFHTHTICQKSRSEAEALWENPMFVIFCPIDQLYCRTQVFAAIYVYAPIHSFEPIGCVGFSSQDAWPVFELCVSTCSWLGSLASQKVSRLERPKRLIYYGGFHVLSMSTAKGSLNNTVLWFSQPGVLLPLLFFFDIHSFKASTEICCYNLIWSCSFVYFRQYFPPLLLQMNAKSKDCLYFELGNRSTSGGCNESSSAKSNS